MVLGLPTVLGTSAGRLILQSGGKGTAKPTITTGEVELEDGRSIIPVTVRNDGGEVADSV